MSNPLARPITFSSVLTFTLPSIVMMVVMSLYTVVDGIFVARLIGTHAFSAVNIIYPLLSVVIALGAMFSTGGAALLAKKLGEGKQREANENFTFIVIVAVCIGVLIALGCFVFLDQIIFALGANHEVFDYCRDYALPLLPFIPASILQLAYQSWFVANGKPNTGLVVTILGGLTNIVLDYVFIALCDMGIGGAALATGLGYCVPALYGLWDSAVHRNTNLYFVWPQADWKAVAESSINGSSEMVTYVSTSITTLLFNVMMMRFMGPDGVAAVAILLYLDFALVSLAFGYSLGVSPLFSFNYGSGQTAKLKDLYRLSIQFCVATGIMVSLGTIAFADPLAAMFAPRDSIVFELARHGLRIFAIGYLFKGYNVFASALFTAFNNGKVSAFISFMRSFVLLTGSILGLTALFGMSGIWPASPVAEIVAFGLALFLVRQFREVYTYA